MSTWIGLTWFSIGSSGDCPGNRNGNLYSVKSSEFLV
jgi:hypothetical protein